MALRLRKKSSETSPKSAIPSRNSSPAYSLIKSSLLSDLKSFTKHSKSSSLSLQDLQMFLHKLHFTPKNLSEDYLENVNYMWSLLSKNSHIHISDAFSYILSLLDIAIPKSLLEKAPVFPHLNSDFSHIKNNSSSFLKHYLENLYAKSKDYNFFVGSSKTRTPKFKEDLHVQRGENLKRPQRNSSAKPRLKRSNSNSRNQSRDSGSILVPSENRKKSPINSDLTSTRHKPTKIKV